MQPIFLQLTLMHTSGRYRSSALSGDTLGHLTCVIWINGYDVGGNGAMHMSVMDGGRVRTIESEGRELAVLWGLLRAAGIPDRGPDVAGVVDTSANWHNTSLRIGHTEGHVDIELSMMESGFRGGDAAAMRAFFKSLLDLAGVENPEIRRQLTGL